MACLRLANILLTSRQFTCVGIHIFISGAAFGIPGVCINDLREPLREESTHSFIHSQIWSKFSSTEKEFHWLKNRVVIRVDHTWDELNLVPKSGKSPGNEVRIKTYHCTLFEHYSPVSISAIAKLNSRMLCGFFSIDGFLTSTIQKNKLKKKEAAAIKQNSTWSVSSSSLLLGGLVMSVEGGVLLLSIPVLLEDNQSFVSFFNLGADSLVSKNDKWGFWSAFCYCI